MPGPIFRCERCKIAPDRKDYGGDFDQESAAAVRLAEINTNFGVIAFMCLNCRREWVRYLNGSAIMKAYSEAGFKLAHWQTFHRRTGKGSLDEGLGLFRTVNNMDEGVYQEAMDWIKAGPDAKEWARRGDKPDPRRDEDD